MSYLSYLTFEVTLLASSCFYMIGKVVEVVYGIFMVRKKMKYDEHVANAIRVVADTWIKKIVFDECEKQENNK